MWTLDLGAVVNGPAVHACREHKQLALPLFCFNFHSVESEQLRSEDKFPFKNATSSSYHQKDPIQDRPSPEPFSYTYKHRCQELTHTH